MKLIVGLGNPGKKYESTRHNIGFILLDLYAEKNKLQFKTKTKFKGQVATFDYNGESVILLKPLTYMNLSGESIRELQNFYQIENKDMLVIYDDLDLPTGKIRFKQKGSSGGHNGIKSIIQHIKTEEFDRLKVGIEKHPSIPVTNYVLGKFSKAEQESLFEVLHKIDYIIDDWLKLSMIDVMNKYN